MLVPGLAWVDECLPVRCVTAEQVQFLYRLDLLCFCLNKGVECFLSWDSLLCRLKQKQSCAFLFQITLQAFSLSLLILF